MTSYWPGVLLSVMVHLLLVALLSWSWLSSSTPEINKPRYIKATLIELEAKTPVKPKVDPAKVAAEEMRRRQLEKEKQAQKQKEKKEQEKTKAREKRIREQQAEARKANIAREKALQERRKRERLEQQKQLELAQQQQAVADELAREQQRLALEEQAQTDRSISQSYSALIASRIEQNWSRPPSARKGMRCELEIQMVPTGQVIDVKVTKSSGNLAFDRSAIQAVKKIERFSEVKDIPSRIFERYFRTFKLNFNPQDLRL